VFLEQGIMVRLVELLRSHDPALRLNALWAIKNLLRKTATDTKRDVMDQLGWRELSQYVFSRCHSIALIYLSGRLQGCW
jgi:hypothetical protein